MATIRADHYREDVDRLIADPIVRDMAGGLAGESIANLTHDDGTPRFEFLLAANAEYTRRAGHGANAHLGGVPEALVAILLGNAS